MATHPVSLLMIIHKCHEYYALGESLNELFYDLLPWEDEKSLPDEMRDRVNESADQAVRLIRSLKGISPTVAGVVERIASDLAFSRTLSVSRARGDMERLSDILKDELSQRKFLFIPPPEDKSIRKSRPFGRAVYDAFPSARAELTNAGTAFAVELYTASVFHLMRATEIAMRALCNDRGIIAVKGAPVEMAQWNDIITELDGVSTQIGSWPKTMGTIKSQAQEFYNGAASAFRGIKDQWRNHVAHMRTDYNRPRAEEAMDNVRTLMQTLATRITETTATPKIWTAAELR